MPLTVPVKLLLSLFLGMAIGLERESYERRIDQTKRSGVGSLGIRSYALITTLGTVAALTVKSYFSLFLIISVSFSALLIAYYVVGSIFSKDNGLTTELAILWSYLIGIFIGLELFPLNIIIAMAVGVTLILSVKEKLRIFIASIKEYEIESFIAYAIIALVILPFLPNTSITINNIPMLGQIVTAMGANLSRFSNVELINPFNVWKVVVIITGVDIFGYLLEKAIGQKSGWLLTSFIGGFISSTSTVQSLALQSKSTKNANRLTAAALFANLSSFLQQFILLVSINSLFSAKSSIYIISLSLATLILGLYFLKKKGERSTDLKQTKEAMKNRSIFSLGPALQFALIFMIIKIITKVSLVLFGNGGFIVSNILGALTGLDAVTFNIAELAGKTISYQTGVLTLILANAVNLLSKSAYVFVQGKREFAVQFFVSVILMVAASLVGLIPLYR